MSARAMIDRAMLEAIVGTIKPGRVLESKEEKLRKPAISRGRPWKLPIDLRCPVSRDGRPRTIDGATSFHFRVSTVSRHDDVAGALDGNRAAGHEAYLVTDREQAAAERQFGERYLVEPKSDQLEAMAEGRAILVNSSIGDTLAERETFWNERWAGARKAGDELIEIFPQRGSLADWRDLASDRQAPGIIQDAASAIVETLERGEHPDKRVAIAVEAETVRDWATGLRSRFGASKAQRMIHYRAPRGGAVQERFELEMPADLPLAQVSTIIDSMGEKLRGFGLAFTLVVHAPDARNDRRNLHVHMVLYRRRLPVQSDGTLDLCDAGVALRPGDIATMFGVPLDRATTHHRERAAADVAALRNFYAELVNRELTGVGADRRFDPRSYAAMGIDKAPEAHLGNAAFTLLNAGVMTDLARANAVRSWQSGANEVERQLAEEHTRHVAQVGVWNRLTATLAPLEYEQVTRSIARYDETAERLRETASALTRFDLDEAMARSAADRLLRTSQQLIDERKSARGRRRNERDILARNRLAAAHLAEIDEALEPHREPIARQRDAAAQMRSELARIEADITATIAAAKVERDAIAPWSEATVLPPSRYPTRLRSSDHCAALIDHVFTQAGADSIIDPNRALLVHKATDGTGQMTILGLRPADIELMQDPRWRRRLEPAFTKAYDVQRHAVDRLLAHVCQHGRETLERGRSRLGDPVNSTLVRLRDAYSSHPEFKAGLPSAENAYRTRHDRVGSPVESTWRDLDHAPPISADGVLPNGAPVPVATSLPDALPPLPSLPESGPETDKGVPLQSIAPLAGGVGTAGRDADVQPIARVGTKAPFIHQPAVASASVSADQGARSTPPRTLEHRAIAAAAPAVETATARVRRIQAEESVWVAPAWQADDIESDTPELAAPAHPTAQIDNGAGANSVAAPPLVLPAPPRASAPDRAVDAPHLGDAPLEPQRPAEAAGDPVAHVIPTVPAPAKPRAEIEPSRPAIPPWRSGKDRKASTSGDGQRPTDLLRAQMTKSPSAPDRNTVLAMWRTRIHAWAAGGDRTEDEFARSLLLKGACRMAEHGDLDFALDASGRLDLFVRTNEAEALVGQLRNIAEGRKSLRMIAGGLPPLADRRNFTTITIPPEQEGPDDVTGLATTRDGRGL